MTKTVVLRTFKTRTEAELAKNLLASNAIESILMSGDQAGTDPGLSVLPYSAVTAVKLLVAEKDLPKAKDLLEKF